MQTIISEEEQAHIYSCLLVGNSEFGKIKKSLAKLNREDQKVDDEIALNAALRRQFNPRAEEEARDRERAKIDPAQLDIADQVGSSGETGGRTRTKLAIVGEEQVPPTDEVLRDMLMLVDRFVLLSDIRGWTSQDRDAAQRWAGAVHLYASDNEHIDVPEEPECVAAVALTEERVDALNRIGPYKTKSLPEGADDSTSVQIILPPDTPDDEALVEGEYVDGVEAEIRVARLNRDEIKKGDLSTELVTRWLVAGPWTIIGEGERWYVAEESEGVKEFATSEEDARYTAARYNRTIAGRENDGSWKEPPPPRLAEDDLQEIKAAAEGE